MIFFLLIMHLFLNVVQCFTPNCVPENQFRNFEFPVDGCSENFQSKCKFHPKGYFKSLGVVSLVKIKETTVIPTCAFYNAESLRYIYGVNSNIEVLATGAFINLSNLKSILLSFNHIKEVREDVFRNISVELIDLSWNKITYIDSNAFTNVSGLKVLNLSRNSLMTLSISHLANTLESLNIAHNFLKAFALNSDAFLNLTYVDASSNMINKVAISFKYPAMKFDLTDNRLQNFDYMDISSVEKLRIGKNLFEETPQYLENINVNELEIHPNPWKCDKLMLLWETLVSFNIRLARRTSKISTPECTQSSARLLTTRRSNNCMDDHECPHFMACRARKCWDPCEESLCHNSSQCETKKHIFNCFCPAGLLADPLDIHSECKNVECFTDGDCPNSFYCWDHRCIMHQNIVAGADRYPADDNDDGPIWDPVTSKKALFPPPPPSTPSPAYSRAKPQDPWWFEEIPSILPPPAPPLRKKIKTL